MLWFCYWTPGGFSTDNAIITPVLPYGLTLAENKSAVQMVRGPHYGHAQRINSVLKTYGNFLLGHKSTGIYHGSGESGCCSAGLCGSTATCNATDQNIELPKESVIASVNNTGAGPTFEFLLGQFDLLAEQGSGGAGSGGTADVTSKPRTAVVVHNQDHAHSLLASLTLRGASKTVEELDPSTGVLGPAFDDAPHSPGFQLLLTAGNARVLVIGQ